MEGTQGLKTIFMKKRFPVKNHSTKKVFGFRTKTFNKHLASEDAWLSVAQVTMYKNVKSAILKYKICIKDFKMGGRK